MFMLTITSQSYVPALNGKFQRRLHNETLPGHHNPKLLKFLGYHLPDTEISKE